MSAVGFGLSGRGLRRWPRCGVVLRRRRDDDQRRRKILGGRRKRRGKGDRAPAPRQHIEQRSPSWTCFLSAICSRRGATYRRASPRRKSHLEPPQPIRLFASPVAHLSAAFQLRPPARRFLRIALKNRRALSYHTLRKKRNSRAHHPRCIFAISTRISPVNSPRATIGKPDDRASRRATIFRQFWPALLCSRR